VRALPAEWVFERGIGEDRAALIEDGVTVEAIIDPHDLRLRAGAILSGRLVTLPGLVRLDSGEEVLVARAPGVTEGATVSVEIIREAIAEPGVNKRAMARLADAPCREGMTLLERLEETRWPVRTLHPHDDDALEAAGWSDVLETASTGCVGFVGGDLRIVLTPAMTLIDVDGSLAPSALAIAGAQAAARAICCFGITGNIGIDLPTADRAARDAAARAVDAILPKPFERTGINGFGFLQIIRRRTRASMLEQVQYDPAARARADLRRYVRDQVRSPQALPLPETATAFLREKPHFIAPLSLATGKPVTL
jgi:hypothetical protein